MSTLAERISHTGDPGYWAVEVRLDEASGRGKRYLCHAENSRMAFGMAVRLAGTTRNLRGFNSFWIDEDRVDATKPETLPIGAYGDVSDALEWDHLMDAHQASETALAARQTHASA